MLRTHENYHNTLFVNTLSCTRLANYEPHPSPSESAIMSQSLKMDVSRAKWEGWLYEMRTSDVDDVVGIMKHKDLLTLSRKEVLVSSREVI